jgi:hypothetical protein
MSTINYRIKIGEKEYDIPIEMESKEEGKVLLDGDDFLRAQWELGKKLVKEHQDPTTIDSEMFNFLVDISGMTNTEVAQYICVDPASISQWRRKKGISATAWQTFRLFFYDLFSNGHITNEIFILNKSKRIAA